jgi:hypothetical protein
MSYVFIPFMPSNTTGRCLKAPDGHYYWELNGRQPDLTNGVEDEPLGECADCGAVCDGVQKYCPHCGGGVYPY